MLLGRVVHEHVQAPELGHGRLDGLGTELRASDVAGDRYAAPAFALDEARRLLRVLSLVKIDDGHICAFAREEDRDGTADAAVAAGDQRHLALEPAAAAKTGRVVGLGRHGALATGLPVLVLRGERLFRLCHGLRPLPVSSPPLTPPGMRCSGAALVGGVDDGDISCVRSGTPVVGAGESIGRTRDCLGKTGKCLPRLLRPSQPI